MEGSEEALSGKFALLILKSFFENNLFHLQLIRPGVLSL